MTAKTVNSTIDSKLHHKNSKFDSKKSKLGSKDCKLSRQFKIDT